MSAMTITFEIDPNPEVNAPQIAAARRLLDQVETISRLAAAEAAARVGTPADPAEVVDAQPSTLNAVLEDLQREPSTKDVTRALIVPLCRHGLEVKGDVREVLTTCAATFRVVSRRKLEFAVRHLTREGGRHKLFPEHDEILAAIGAYDLAEYGRRPHESTSRFGGPRP